MKPLLMLAAVATSALLLVPTVATAQTLAVSASVPANDITVTADNAKLDARIARAINKLCAETGMRGFDRVAMENYCIASAKVNVPSAQLASNGKKRNRTLR